MNAQKKRPHVGDETWFVEWCSKLAWKTYADGSRGDVDRDNCTMQRRQFATRTQAETFARKVWPKTHQTFGVVAFWPAKFTAYEPLDHPWIGYWDAIGDVEVIDDLP